MTSFQAKTYMDFGKLYLSVTHNGYQWSSLYLSDPKVEIPQIIKVLEKALKETLNNGRKCKTDVEKLRAEIIKVTTQINLHKNKIARLEKQIRKIMYEKPTLISTR